MKAASPPSSLCARAADHPLVSPTPVASLPIVPVLTSESTTVDAHDVLFPRRALSARPVDRTMFGRRRTAAAVQQAFSAPGANNSRGQTYKARPGLHRSGEEGASRANGVLHARTTALLTQAPERRHL